MKIVDLIGPDRIILGVRVGNKAQLLQELARRAAIACGGLDQNTILRALQVREALGSTGLGKGFALPHARSEELDTPIALFVRLSRPVDFAAVDERPVDLVILLLTPANRPNEHLSTLAAVSRPMRDETFVRRLRQARDAAEVYAALTEAG